MRRLGVAAAMVVLATACSSGGGEATPEATPTPVALEPTPTAEPVDEPTATPEPEPTPVPSDPEGAEEAWRSFWGAVAVPDDDAAGLETALAWGSQEAIDQVRSFPWGSADRDIELFPVLEAGSEAFTVNDCMFFTPGFGTNGGGVWWAGTVEQVDGAWTVTAADRVSNFDPCVPAELAEAAIAGYEAYLDAFLVIFNPPDPDSELIEQTMTGNQLAALRPAIESAREEGWTVQGGSENHPEVTQMPSSTSVVLLDCYMPTADYGAYRIDTGERLDAIIAPVSAGERDLAQVEMVREEGEWKVFGINALLNSDCDFELTEDGLQQV